MKSVSIIAYVGSLALFTSACANVTAPASPPDMQTESQIADCLRVVQKLDEGTWNYMGTIARLSGQFRTYETTSIHAAAGPDTWSSTSFGGDMSEEESGETSYVKLIGTSLVPVEDGELNEEGAVRYTSCVGPDAEGRYEATLEYAIPLEDGAELRADTVSWYSEHGSYYSEDLSDPTGRIVARRSGVTWPASETP